jgi:Fe-S cluster assembly protein SufB
MAENTVVTASGKKRTQVADIDRSMYDFRYDDADAEKLDAGLTPDIVREISERKNEPEWMLEHRLRSLEIYNSMPVSDWGPSIDGLDMDNIVTYVKPNTDQQSDWESVPENIKDTFDRLGIPQAERSYLAGVGAQYDSELVYHSMQESAAKMGIVYSGIEEALHGEYADLIREKFMTLIPPTDHKFAALHGAVWSGGSFVYVPKGVRLDYPLQSYFRLNAKGAGQFEHTLIIVEDDADLHFIEGCSAPKYNVANLHAGAVELFIGKRAHLRYSTIENWSKNMYNLNTKRARCDEEGEIEWISGSFGSHVGYLYPMSILAGRKSRASFTGITFAGRGQNLDTGCKVVLAAPDTAASVETKGISKDGGIQTFRSSVVATPNATGSRCTVSCQSLMLDDRSRSDTIPAMDIRCKNVDIGHEATIGRIGDDKIFYLMSRGISEEEARMMIVNGFAEPISKELPLEYAVEMNNLIKLEMEGAIG